MSALPSDSSSRTAALAASIPVARTATTTEVAAAITFLSSEDAAYLTGTTLDIDTKGGLELEQFVGIFGFVALIPTDGLNVAVARSADLAGQLSAMHGEIDQLRRKAATASAPAVAAAIADAITTVVSAPRGAWRQQDLDRQTDKIVTAISEGQRSKR